MTESQATELLQKTQEHLTQTTTANVLTLYTNAILFGLFVALLGILFFTVVRALRRS